MGAIASAYSFAGDHKFSLKVIWERNRTLGASFSDLFENLPDVPVIESVPLIRKNALDLQAWLNLYLDENPVTVSNPVKRFIFSNLRRERKMTSIYQSEFWKMIKEGSLINYIKSEYNVYLATCWTFGHYGNYSIFCPRPAILRSIEDVRYCFNDFTIGVHIRRGDHKECVLTTPVPSFLAAMNQELTVEPRTNFYLATDCAETKKILLDRFSGKIMCHEADLTRSTHEGMVDALTDIFCLSSTKKLIANERSTFSSVASKLGSIPLRNPNSY